MSQILEYASWIYPSEDIGEICPVFRKHFTARPGAAAKLEITAFGVYEAFLNGQRIGNFSRLDKLSDAPAGTDL